MEIDKLFLTAESAIRGGGQETFRSPPIFSCAAQTHEPFDLMMEPGPFHDEDEQFLWGIVRTSGAQFDGDRTDIHDVFSLMWGAILRTFGLSSPWLIDEEHGFVPGEIGIRYLVLQQCHWNLSGNEFKAARESMNAWSAFGFHLLADVFRWRHAAKLTPHALTTIQQTENPVWADQLIKYLRRPKDVTISRRTFPFWTYFASRQRGVTIIRLTKVRMMYLKVVLRPFVPETVNGENALVMLANGIPNAVPYKSIKKATKLLSLTKDGCNDIVILPLDSHCLFIGDKTIVALQGEYGRKIYEREIEFLGKRRRREDRFLFADSVIKWRKPLHAGDFEDLCRDLIQREPGVVRAKLVGTVNDRDGGRDILIDQKLPNPHGYDVENPSTADGGPLGLGRTRTVRLIAQVKSRSRTVGKVDVQDIRDTLEGHQADGFLLIAFPRISAALVDHLDALRTKTNLYTDWWEDRDIESRLRRHPDLARRYPALVKLVAR